jgi:hypothetical protein
MATEQGKGNVDELSAEARFPTGETSEPIIAKIRRELECAYRI